jgi:DNA-binding CsgD family transcriptional regulator/GAF domain-containing protein
MVDAEQLIKLIYDGASDSAAWNDALGKVGELVRAAGIGLGIQDMKTHEFRSLGYVGIDGSLNPTYRRLSPGNRIWQEIAARKQALTDQMVVRKPEFMRTELYADWFAPQRFHSVMAAPTLFETDATAVLVAFRDRARGDFDTADLAQAQRFAGHFGAALRFRFAQELAAAELAAANFVLDELPDAIFLVSRAGLLHHANAAGQTMLEAGTPVRSQHGRLELHPSTFAERLERLLLAARGELRAPKPGRASWIIQLHLSTRRFGPVEGDFLIVRVIDPDRRGQPLDAAKLSRRLGLTPRQSEAVAALVKGGSEESASTTLGVSKATLHTHLSRVYDHLSVHNRAALVALLARHGFDVAPGNGDEKI